MPNTATKAPALPRYSVAQFTYRDGKFVTECSALGWPVGAPEQMAFALHNPATGRSVQFLLSNARHDADLDVVAWVYKEQPRAGMDRPPLEALIFND